MSTRNLSIPYPDDLPDLLGQSAEQFESEMRLLLAAKLYELGRISSGRAADIAGLSRVEFLKALSRYRISVFNLSTQELEEELAAVKKRTSGR